MMKTECMKTILAAIDFTAASRNAALYAAELAKAFNARLVVFHAYLPIPVPLSEALVTMEPDDPEPIIDQSLHNEIEELDPTGLLEIEPVHVRGRASDAIKAAARAWHADLIVMGMKQEDKGLRRLFGSTVTALIGKMAIPLLVVPEEARFTAIKSIALATDKDIDENGNDNLTDALCAIGQQFHSRLYVVRVVNNVPGDGFLRPTHLHQQIRGLSPEYVYSNGMNILKDLKEFTDKNNISMLAMIPHQHTLLEKWFLTSQTKAMAFATHIPLLLLPERQ